MKHRAVFGIILVGIVLSAPAAAQMSMAMPTPAINDKPKIPSMIADQSKAKSLPSPAEPGMRGYGTKVVSGETLAEMKTRCAVSGVTAVGIARCDQLRRTLQTAPSNTR